MFSVSNASPTCVLMLLYRNYRDSHPVMKVRVKLIVRIAEFFLIRLQ